MTIQADPNDPDLAFVNVSSKTVSCTTGDATLNVTIEPWAAPGTTYLVSIKSDFGLGCAAVVAVSVTGFDILIDGVSAMVTSDGLEPEFDPGAFVCLNSNDSNSNGIPDLEDFANLNPIPSPPPDDDFVRLTLVGAGLDPARTVRFNHNRLSGRLRVWEEKNGVLERVTFFPIDWNPNLSPPFNRGAFPGTATFWVEGIAASTAHRDAWMRFNYAPPNNNECKDPVRWTVIETDLDADSNNNGTIDPDNSSMGTDDLIEADTTTSGLILCINDGFLEGKLGPQFNPQHDFDDPSPINIDGNEVVLTRMKICDAQIVPNSVPADDAVLANATITLTQVGGSGSVRVLAINPNRTAPFWDDWVQVMMNQNLVDDFYKSTSPYRGWKCWFEGLTVGEVVLEFRFERANVVCTDQIQITVIDPQYEDIEVVYRTFISPEAIEGPTFSTDYAGDNRCFSYTATSSRTSQVVSLSLDPVASASGVLGTPVIGFGTTRAYDALVATFSCVTTCAGCALTEQCLFPGSTATCIATAANGAGGNILSVTSSRLLNGETELGVDVVGTNPCALAAPAIDVHLTMQFRMLCNSLNPVAEFKLSGNHDGYPWHELYINGTPVYTHDPCKTGEGATSLFGSGERDYLVPGFNTTPVGILPLGNWQPVPSRP